MVRTLRVSFVLFVALVFRCAEKSPVVRPPEPPRPAPKLEFLSLERSACYGRCPTYRIRVSGDGRVEYEGVEFVQAKGNRTKVLTAAQLSALSDEVSKVRYFELRDSYRSEEDGCPSMWTDNPVATTSVQSGGRTKTIRHDYGCQSRTPADSMVGEIYPPALTLFERRIDEIVGTSEWVSEQIHVK